MASEKPLEFEADVSPRPNGKRNGTVNIADWVLAGRFYVGLDVLMAGSEFQRADCFPKETKGDGKISIGDWVQAGRYAAGLDSVATIGGPITVLNSQQQLVTTESFAAAEAQTRMMRAKNTSFQRGQSGLLQIELEAQENENAIAFSLGFDPKLIIFVDAAVGDGANGAALQIS